MPPEGAYLTPQALDDWAKDTNGTAFDAESKEELLMFMDCTEEGGLTCVTPLSSYARLMLRCAILGSKASYKYTSYRPSAMKKRHGRIWYVTNFAVTRLLIYSFAFC